MKNFIAALTVLFVLLPVYSFASSKFQTKFPIVLAHGAGLKNPTFGVEYFWKVESSLEKEGASVYPICVDGMNTTEEKAKQFKKQLLEILSISEAAKVNIIGHCHGAIYTRYAISNLQISQFVASHTGLTAPNRGSAIADLLSGLLPGVKFITGEIMNVFYKYMMGDPSPDSLGNLKALTRPFMVNFFNPNTPNVSSIYYQSYAAQKKGITADLALEPTFLIMSIIEGENDGIVSTTSAKWGNYRGKVSGAWWSSGVSHINVIGQFLGVTPGWDHIEFYKGLAADLKSRGF